MGIINYLIHSSVERDVVMVCWCGVDTLFTFSQIRNNNSML